MPTLSWHNSSTSKSHFTIVVVSVFNNVSRQNPAVVQQAARCFHFVALALEAETLQGRTAQQVVQSAKTLVTMASLDANQLLAEMSPEVQHAVRAFFG